MTYTAPNLAMVDIATVHTDAIRVSFDKVRAGDWVFDAWGDRHKLTSARVLKDGTLSIKREDYSFREHFAPTSAPDTDERYLQFDGTIVIVPEHGWTFHGAGYRNVLDNDGVRVGGEFYETCRCGQTFGSDLFGDDSVADERLRHHADEANGREFYCG